MKTCAYEEIANQEKKSSAKWDLKCPKCDKNLIAQKKPGGIMKWHCEGVLDNCFYSREELVD